MNTLSQKEAWILATRPQTLPAALGPVILGMAAAASMGKFHLLSGLLALVTALLLQIAVNLANDYFDAKAGHDNDRRIGPLRVTQSGLIEGKKVLLAMALCMILASFSGSYLIYRGGIPALFIAFFSLMGVLTYSAGPFPMTEKGLGEAAAFLFFGPVAVCGTTWVMALTFSPTALLASLPAGMLIAAILSVNNIRDIEGDAASGKRTLAVRIGPMASRYCFTGLVAGAYLFPLIIAIRSNIWMLLAMISFPKAIVVIQSLWHMDGRLLNEVLAHTARLSFFFCLLYAAALVIGP
ncbi:1,4-dihydroxy-2-naphthoate polyprenyltransferase [Desulfobotulus sp. H1]|uniref:1,4-dihydroxy-2-naphthoate octaprenyltransferase n=1 Tax=Desulfobotulus pelophilus TaxID=2823377 RepID=A0ABT3N728_9BACT|nr:1,4-dihydroxy-2-naphthoate polyprenyltransferase [Desulfobotulus pelophilus]MCW7753264.1 1,4-dihydroxy-2-naphthoate polyprenyltransferase [Desulfobotulus pelophilus]